MSKKTKNVLAIITVGLTVSLSACNDQPRQQSGEVAVDTTAGQDIMMIDTTSSASYGTAGEAPAVAPDLDTFKYIDRGVKHDEVFDKEKKNP